MKELIKGQKISLEKELKSLNFSVSLNWDQSDNPEYEIDASLMLLSDRGKMEEESDFIFYNQPDSQCRSISLKSKPANAKKSVDFDLKKINPDVSRILLLMTIEDGDKLNRRFSDIRNIRADIRTDNNSVLFYKISNLSQETALIVLEIYKHNNEWKLKSVGDGFNAGLAAIIREYGSDKVQVTEEPVTDKKTEIPETSEKIPAGSIDFVKKHKARIDLAKKAVSSINLTKQKAQILMVVDISFSMQGMFKNGTVQDTFDRVLPLALQFDDDGEIDVWLFHDEAFNHNVTYNLENRENYVNLEILRNYGWGGTYYAPIIKKITAKYQDSGMNDDPVFVLFFTDGDCSDRRKAEKAMIEASEKAIFWKFIGMGGSRSGFKFLENLDELDGRKVDNANFIHVNDLNKIEDPELYKRLLEEFPDWLKAAKEIRITK